MADELPLLRTPWQLGGLRIPHRVVMGSMHTGLEVGDDGEGLAAFYRERVDGGAGLVITGGLAVSEIGRGGPDYAVLPEAAPRLAVAVRAVHEAGGLIAAQLFHAGRYAVLPEGSVAPSAVPWRAARGIVPRALDGHEVLATIDDFARAASAAHSAGFDAVEVMASEGYLVNQFCSPITNLRDDEWGGDAARRRRFAVELVTAVRGAVPAEMAVLVRMSGNDLMPGSSTPEEVDALALALLDAGVDGISVGVGWHESVVPTVQGSVPRGAWLPEAERIAAVVGGAVPVIASNRINDLRDAERVLERGTVDAVALARPFLADPTIVARSFAGDFTLVNSCIACNQACIDRSLVFQPVSCLVNPRAGRETVFPLELSATRSRVAVVGAGPAGLAAALDLARRGHAVTLFEAGEPGGQFGLAARIPGKEDYALTVSSALAELDVLGAALSFGVTATTAALAKFDGVIVATGVRPRTIDIPGFDLPHVISYEHAIQQGVPEGPVAIIGGGGIGVDVASFLVESHDERSRAVEFSTRFGLGPTDGLARPGPALSGSSGRRAIAPRPGSDVTILRRSGKFGQGVGISSRWVVLSNLRAAGVRMLGGVQYRAITPDGVEVESAEGVELVPARTVIVCAGQVERSGLADELDAAGIRHLVVGGARHADGVDAVRATSEALAAAREITTASR
ncbi:MAG: FAD-dependent oxidoreductase [Microbacteriaceae bacterium]|nr:FAD-dependent oxidoreductase [Microbacteriaceae bacterium]